MISLQAFIKKYQGKTCKHPKGIAGQCVCLIRCYVDEVLGVPQFAGVVGAKNMWTSYDPKYFTAIKNTPKGIPLEGDIVIMDAFKGNPNGHVFIALAGSNIRRIPCFESNWAVPKKAMLGSHEYINPKIIGWLRKK